MIFVVKRHSAPNRPSVLASLFLLPFNLWLRCYVSALPPIRQGTSADAVSDASVGPVAVYWTNLHFNKQAHFLRSLY